MTRKLGVALPAFIDRQHRHRRRPTGGAAMHTRDDGDAIGADQDVVNAHLSPGDSAVMPHDPSRRCQPVQTATDPRGRPRPAESRGHAEEAFVLGRASIEIQLR